MQMFIFNFGGVIANTDLERFKALQKGASDELSRLILTSKLFARGIVNHTVIRNNA